MAAETNLQTESVAKFVESLVPDEARRRKLLEFFANSIENAHEANPSSWSLTLRKDKRLIRLNVGRVMVLDVFEDTADITLFADEDDAAVAKPAPERDTSRQTVGHRQLEYQTAKPRPIQCRIQGRERETNVAPCGHWRRVFAIRLPAKHRSRRRELADCKPVH